MIRVRPIRFWSHKVLPLVYDDALSYYEVLNKVVCRFNEIAEIINQLQDEMALLNPEKVEEMLTEIRESIVDLTERVASAEESVESIEDGLATLQSDMESLEEIVSGHTTDINTLKNDMIEVSGGLATQGELLNGALTRLTSAEGNITNLQGRMTTAESNISSLLSRVTALERKTPSVAFIPVSGGIRVQMDNAGAIALADQNLGRPVAVVNSGTLTGGDASDAVEWIEAVLEAKENGKIIQIYSPDYAYLTEVCYYKHSDSWIELNFSRPAFEDLTYHYDYNMGYFIDVNATNPNAVSYKVTTTACATRFAT